MHFDETLKLMKILKDHGVDMFNVSAGLHSEGLMKYMRYWLQGYTMPRGFKRPLDPEGQGLLSG
jgi:hypothetical protein